MSLPTDPRGALENISLNLGGDLDRLPPHILSYKLQMVKGICDGALRRSKMPTDPDSQEVRANVDALVRYAQASADENRTLRKKLDEARRMFEAIIKTNGEFAITQAQLGIGQIDR